LVERHADARRRRRRRRRTRRRRTRRRRRRRRRSRRRWRRRRFSVGRLLAPLPSPPSTLAGPARHRPDPVPCLP
jgi:hypothetical protein